jgi:plasmid maintenance system antidote protein VapI
MKIKINKICKDHDTTQKQLARELKVTERTVQNMQYGKFKIKASIFISLLTFTGESLEGFVEQYVEK